MHLQLHRKNLKTFLMVIKSHLYVRTFMGGRAKIKDTHVSLQQSWQFRLPHVCCDSPKAVRVDKLVSTVKFQLLFLFAVTG